MLREKKKKRQSPWRAQPPRRCPGARQSAQHFGIASAKAIMRFFLVHLEPLCCVVALFCGVGRVLARPFQIRPCGKTHTHTHTPHAPHAQHSATIAEPAFFVTLSFFSLHVPGAGILCVRMCLWRRERSPWLFWWSLAISRPLSLRKISLMQKVYLFDQMAPNTRDKRKGGGTPKKGSAKWTATPTP